MNGTWNLQDKGCFNCVDMEWQTLFAICCWLIWKSRNESIFSNSHRNAQTIISMSHIWTMSYLEFDNKMKVHPSTNLHSKWSPPNTGWIKLNSDGAVSLDGQFLTIGGVLCDYEGKWLWGYNMNLGSESIFKTEARSMLEGLFLAWDKGYKKIEIESDNALLVDLLNLGGGISSNLMEVRFSIVSYDIIGRLISVISQECLMR